MNQSFQQVFVTNSGTLLASGTTTDLAAGQIGFFDADTYAATTTPTFFKNKGLIVAWGYPDIDTSVLMSGQFNENEKSPTIFGRKIKRVRVHKARHPRPEIITAGWSGDEHDTDTLAPKVEETKAFYLRLTGAPIDRLYSTQGFIRRYFVKGTCADNCSDDCADTADCRAFVKDLVRQINEDPKVKGLVKASYQVECNPTLSESTVNCYAFRVTVCDDGSDNSLGFVQAQYPGVTVTKVDRSGSNTTYEIVKSVNSAPTAVSNAGLSLIPDCPSCPAGYTLVATGQVYEVKRADAGSSGNLTTVASDYSITSPETAVRVSYQNGVSTYILVSATALTVVGTDQLVFVGASRNSCVITSATTTAWALYATLVQYPKVYTITVKDNDCGSNRLTDLQAAFPALTIAVVDASGTCVHTYSTTIYSNCVPVGCSRDLLNFVAPQAFEGVDWVGAQDAALDAGQTCKCGITLVSAWVDRITNACTYDSYPYEADTVHVEFSEYDANYNGEPERCKVGTTVVKLIQSIQYPQGSGQFVRKLEERSKELFLKSRSSQPLIREIEGFQFITDPTKYYDQITIEFDKDYKVGGFSTHYTDSYHLNLFVQEGKGASHVAALNSYITSPEIALAAVTL